MFFFQRTIKKSENYYSDCNQIFKNPFFINRSKSKTTTDFFSFANIRHIFHITKYFLLKFVKNKRELENYLIKSSFSCFSNPFTVLTVKQRLQNKTIPNVLNNNIVLILIMFVFDILLNKWINTRSNCRSVHLINTVKIHF